MAKDIVKLYLNINDAVNGVSKWDYNGLPVYPMIVTYEDWYLMWPMAFDRLIEFVKRRLESKDRPAIWVETMPFFSRQSLSSRLPGKTSIVSAYKGTARQPSCDLTAISNSALSRMRHSQR